MEKRTPWRLVARTLQELRPAFSRNRTFCWFSVAVVGMLLHRDLFGVTSLVRALHLPEWTYDRILDVFHSHAWRVQALARCWVRWVMKQLPLVTIRGKPALVSDGHMNAKSGRRMPAVKTLHQSSESNTKPDYITGHSTQAIGVLAKGGERVFALPLFIEIVEGLVFSNRDKRTILDKLYRTLDWLGLRDCYLIADAYYASGTLMTQLAGLRIELITRVRGNAIAFLLPEPVRRRGRPRKYGRKIRLMNLACDWTGSMPSPFENDAAVLSYRCENLIAASGRLIRYVIVCHPTRGTVILASTDLTLTAQEIITAYALRFKIEVTFKQAVHTVGTFNYHFWMKGMDRLSRWPRDQYLHRKSGAYRSAVRRKIEAYHRFLQLGVIAHGLIQMLAIQQPRTMWRHFGSWMRTMNTARPPSEFVVAEALRNTATDFPKAFAGQLGMGKFLDHIHPRKPTIAKVRAA
jgi:hypothetical protein